MGVAHLLGQRLGGLAELLQLPGPRHIGLANLAHLLGPRLGGLTDLLSYPLLGNASLLGYLAGVRDDLVAAGHAGWQRLGQLRQLRPQRLGGIHPGLDGAVHVLLALAELLVALADLISDLALKVLADNPVVHHCSFSFSVYC